MTTINVAKRFFLNVGTNDPLEVPAGEQDVSDEVAGHWYTQLFLVSNQPAAEADPSTVSDLAQSIQAAVDRDAAQASSDSASTAGDQSTTNSKKKS